MDDQQKRRKQPPSKFLNQLYQILDDENIKTIKWIEQGFIIENMNQFKNELMPEHFKINQYTSFLRQLNKYGFKVKGKERENTLFTHSYISEQKREFKKNKILRNQELFLNYRKELEEIRQQLLLLQLNQNQLQKQIELSIKVMNLFKKNFLQFQKKTLQTISYGAALSSLISNNLQKVSPNISGDIRLHQLTAAKIAFPEYFESPLITPNQSLLSTPIPFYIAILKELVEMRDNNVSK